MTARGIRNNNPGNIEHNRANRWAGLATPATDGRFCRFTDMKHGVRALAHLLLVYQTKYKLNTVRKIINRWAPPHENNTNAYVNVVAERVAAPDAVIDLHNGPILFNMVRAIINHENGADGLLVSDLAISEGVSLALANPPRGARTGRNVTIATAATAATAGAVVDSGLIDGNTISAVTDTVAAVAPSFTLLRELAPMVGIAVIAATLGFVIWRRYRT